jgi:hypothetical protein
MVRFLRVFFCRVGGFSIKPQTARGIVALRNHLASIVLADPNKEQEKKIVSDDKRKKEFPIC